MTLQKNSSQALLVIGLTGGIGMGKSTVAGILKQMGFPIYSADRAVHDVLKKGGSAVVPVTKYFPEAYKKGAIDRKILGRCVFGNPQKLQKLEKIIHPLLRKAERAAIQRAKKLKSSAIILEIPLLFETGAENRCDIVFCVTAPKAIQKKRVLSRPQMNSEKFKSIVARQMPDAQKRKKADFLIPTGAGLKTSRDHLKKILSKLSLLP